MYEMKPLEDEWIQYKRNKRKPYLFTFLLIVLAIVLFMSFAPKQLNLDALNHYIKKITKMISSEDNKSSITSEEIVKIKVDTSKKEELLVDIPVLDDESNKIQLNIIGTSSVVAYEDVEKRFSQSHDIDDALFLANGYYKRGEYTKSAYWALETNKLDANVEESIFIFVESKIKSGQVNEGISILKKYLKQSNSEKAKQLLFRIENN